MRRSGCLGSGPACSPSLLLLGGQRTNGCVPRDRMMAQPIGRERQVASARRGLAQQVGHEPNSIGSQIGPRGRAVAGAIGPVGGIVVDPAFDLA
jgi:hypothetical protein